VTGVQTCALPISHVDAEQYVPILASTRPDRSERTVEAITIDGKPGALVRKTFDSGRYQYGGPLDRLWVDIEARESYQLTLDDPLSLVASTSSSSTFERPHAGWRVRAQTTTRLWNERAPGGEVLFRYEATIQTFIGAKDGEEQSFEDRTVSGSLPRRWV
jgi:hypothetical protein